MKGFFMARNPNKAQYLICPTCGEETEHRVFLNGTSRFYPAPGLGGVLGKMD
jgi:hypothetical protein